MKRLLPLLAALASFLSLSAADAPGLVNGNPPDIKTLKVGDKAPDFSAPDETGRPWSLKSLKGRTVVLYFYPKDSTPGCTVEACDYRDRFDAFASASKYRRTITVSVSFFGVPMW